MTDDPLNRLKVKRGTELPHAKLTETDVRLVLDAVAEREKLRSQARTLSNKALAERLGVHVRTIDRITAGENWGHVA